MRKKTVSLLLFVALAVACGGEEVMRGGKTAVISPTATTIPIIPTAIVIDVAEMPVPLQFADYPPSDMPYYIENGDFWLVHTAAGQLFAFVPVSPPMPTTFPWTTVAMCGRRPTTVLKTLALAINGS